MYSASFTIHVQVTLRLIREQLSRANIWDDGRREYELAIVRVSVIASEAALRPSSDAQSWQSPPKMNTTIGFAKVALQVVAAGLKPQSCAYPKPPTL